MTWNITVLVMHLLAAFGCLVLARRAPCWMQQIVVLLLAITQVVLVYVYAQKCLGEPAHWMLKAAALELEHVAVLLYVFRLIYQGHVEWTSSVPSRSLSG